MKTNTALRMTKGILILLTILIFRTGNAQSAYLNEKDHLGFAASFGTRINKVSSNYAAINNMNLIEEGGSAGVIWGSKAIDTRLTIGYYYSSSKVPHTSDLIEIETNANFYPLSLITKKSHMVEPYITAGIASNYYKMYGYYVNEDQLPNNRSVDIEPFLGSINVYMASIGSGVAVSLCNNDEFVKLFADAKYSVPFMSNQSAEFNGTSLSNQLSINLGVSFGMNRLK